MVIFSDINKILIVTQAISDDAIDPTAGIVVSCTCVIGSCELRLL